MRFNYQTTPAHPGKVQRLMREFLEEISTLTYFDEDEEMELLRDIVLRKGEDGFCTEVLPDDESVIKIYYDFSDLDPRNLSVRIFNKNVRTRAPFTRGISDVTIALLHELGHNITVYDLPKNFDRTGEILDIFASTKIPEIRYRMYCDLPDELAATQWAIEWLSDEDNRKRVKKFEKDFFKAWRGE